MKNTARRLVLAGMLGVGFLGMSATSAAAPTYYGEIKALLTEKCVGCHTKGGLGPFALDAYQEAALYAEALVGAVRGGRMPPWLADPGHQEYQDDLSLSEAEKRLLEDWVSGGKLLGDPSDYEPPKRRGFQSDEVHAAFKAGNTYLPRQDVSDDYRCFLVDAGPDGRFMTGFNALPGDRRVVHHLVSYVADASLRDLLKEFDQDEAGLGYECFGGALPDRLGEDEVWQHYKAKYPEAMAKIHDHYYWLAHWAPGMDGGFVFPEGTGAFVPPGGTFVVQVHYYTAHHPGVADGDSAIALMTEKQVEKPGFYVPLSDGRWLHGAEYMEIPPFEKKTFSTGMDLQSVALYGMKVLDIRRPIRGLEVHSANLHMHAAGASGFVSLTDPNGDVETLLSISHWDLGWQRDFVLKQPVVVPWRELRHWRQDVSCTFYHERPQTVVGGFGSKDEMCFNFGFFALRL